MSSETPGRQPIPAAMRRRLQQAFEHAGKSAAQGQFDYAMSMYDQCVKGDPANALYIRQYLACLGKKYNDNKKGAGFTSAPKIKMIQGVLKKSAMSKDHKGILDKGWDALKLNPWDVWTLTTMADAAGELSLIEAQLAYLKQALDVDPKDPETNRKCGRALAAQGAFDQAISCWNRVNAAKPGDEEAARALADLAIERTIHKGKYEEAESSQDVRADKLEQLTAEDSKYTPVQKLEKHLAKNPGDIGKYFELADLHTREERHAEAEQVLAKALEASGGEIVVRERLEDAQLRTARAQLDVARKKAEKERTREAVDLYNRVKKEVRAREIEYFRNRSERYPNKLSYKYELALRLKKDGNIQEAIKSFQASLGDPKTKGKVHLELGECFQMIKQYKLAMQNYEAALEVLGERELDDRKLGLYRAGKLALGLAAKYLSDGQKGPAMDELTRAENYLSELAGLEFGYEDVPQLLDKIAKIRNKE
jgi:tetratricopeptide (TPR) repeat protein